jgi:hypothetical protein
MQNAPRDSAAGIRKQKTAASDQREANQTASVVIVRRASLLRTVAVVANDSREEVARFV